MTLSETKICGFNASAQKLIANSISCRLGSSALQAPTPPAPARMPTIPWIECSALLAFPKTFFFSSRASREAILEGKLVRETTNSDTLLSCWFWCWVWLAYWITVKRNDSQSRFQRTTRWPMLSSVTREIIGNSFGFLECKSDLNLLRDWSWNFSLNSWNFKRF